MWITHSAAALLSFMMPQVLKKILAALVLLRVDMSKQASSSSESAQKDKKNQHLTFGNML